MNASRQRHLNEVTRIMRKFKMQIQVSAQKSLALIFYIGHQKSATIRQLKIN